MRKFCPSQSEFSRFGLMAKAIMRMEGLLYAYGRMPAAISVILGHPSQLELSLIGPDHCEWHAR